MNSKSQEDKNMRQAAENFINKQAAHLYTPGYMQEALKKAFWRHYDETGHKHLSLRMARIDMLNEVA